jgi:hypothetical protein
MERRTEPDRNESLLKQNVGTKFRNGADKNSHTPTAMHLSTYLYPNAVGIM